MPDLDLWPVLLLLLTFALVMLLFFIARTREVPQGHKAVIEKAHRFARTAGPGRYLLWPQEEEVAQLKVRQREATATVPNVFTDGGLSVVVNLRYAYSLDPTLMNESEIYYTDDERTEQQRTLLKHVFQELTNELSQTPTPKSKADRVDMLHLFSPFTGAKLRQIQLKLPDSVRAAFRPHGIVVTAAPVVINGLTLPVEVTRAYVQMHSSNFNSTAQADFIRRLKQASPKLSEGALVQLFNTLQGDAQDMHVIFSGGMLSSATLAEAGAHTHRSGATDPGRGPDPAEGGAASPDPGRPAATARAAQTAGTNPAPHAAPAGAAPSAATSTAAMGAAAVSTPASAYDHESPLTEDDNAAVHKTRED